MKRILIQINEGQANEDFIWVNYPDFMPMKDRNNAITELYGPDWIQVTVTKSVTLKYNV